MWRRKKGKKTEETKKTKETKKDEEEAEDEEDPEDEEDEEEDEEEGGQPETIFGSFKAKLRAFWDNFGTKFGSFW